MFPFRRSIFSFEGWDGACSSLAPVDEAAFELVTLVPVFVKWFILGMTSITMDYQKWREFPR